MWESQVLLTDGQVVFLRVLRFSPTFDERSARYKWNILERAVKPKSKKKKKKKKKEAVLKCLLVPVFFLETQESVPCVLNRLSVQKWLLAISYQMNLIIFNISVICGQGHETSVQMKHSVRTNIPVICSNKSFLYKYFCQHSSNFLLPLIHWKNILWYWDLLPLVILFWFWKLLWIIQERSVCYAMLIKIWYIFVAFINIYDRKLILHALLRVYLQKVNSYMLMFSHIS